MSTRNVRSTRNGRLALVAVMSLAAFAPVAFGQAPQDQGYRTGIGLLNRGLNDLAAVEFRKYLEEQPEGAQAVNARYSLAVCLSRMGKHEEARPLLDVVVKEKAFEFTPDALLLLAQCALSAGDEARAVEVLKDLQGRFGEFKQLDRAAALLGESLYRLGEFDEAAKVLVEVGKRWPKSGVVERAELFAAMAESAAGDAMGAAERAARLRAGAPKGEYALNAALVEARCRQQLKELEAAATLFEVASAGKGAMRAEALLGLAEVSRARGDLSRTEKALEDAEKAGLAGALREWWTLERGKFLFQRGDAAGAAKAFREVRKSSDVGVQAEAAYWAGRVQVKQGKFAEAVANLESAAERFAESPLVADMLFERAGALSQSGDDEGALAAWEQWRTRFKAHELMPEALIGQAWAAHRLGRFDASAQLVDTLVSKHADRKGLETVELLVAENAFARNQFAQALTAYGAFVEHHPSSAHAWRGEVRRTMCLLNLDLDEEAAGALSNALAGAGTQDAGLRRVAITAVADKLFGKGQWAGAEAWFGRLASEEVSGEDKLEALLRQAISVERQERYADALPLLGKVAAEGAGSAQARQARFERGQCLLQLGRLDEAKGELEWVVGAEEGEAGDSLRVHARRHLAAIASKQGRHEEAAGLLAGLSMEGAGASKLELGNAYVAAEKYEEAVAAFTAYVESGAVKDVEKARALRAIAMNRVGRHEEAVTELRTVARAAGLDAETKASAGYELALGLRALKKDAEAGAVLGGLVKDAPSRMGAYARLDLAQMELKAGRLEAALGLLDQCLGATESLAAGDAAVIRERGTYLRGSCLLQMGRAKEAAGALAKFGEAFPKSSLMGAARLVRGEALLASGDAREAAKELELAAESEGAEVRASAELRLGDAWGACQEWGKSERAFTGFLEKASDSPLWFQARFGQGWARENQGRYEPAIEAYREVVARHDGATAARAQFQIGECLYAQKKLEAAVTEFLKTDVLYAYPEWSAAALYEAGRCLEEAGRGEDAAAQFEDLIKRFPETRWAKLAGERKQASVPAAVPGRGTAGSPTAPADGG